MVLSLFISRRELMTKEWSHASVLGSLKLKSSMGDTFKVDAFPVSLVCGVELGLGRVSGVCILRYMLGWTKIGRDG